MKGQSQDVKFILSLAGVLLLRTVKTCYCQNVVVQDSNKGTITKISNNRDLVNYYRSRIPGCEPSFVKNAQNDKYPRVYLL